jgi:hypothetical protein
MRRCLPFLFLLTACPGPKGQSAPPAYTPANSPEPATICRAESDAAKAAREGAIGEESADLGEVAARSVFALAECERRAFDALPLSQADAADEIEALRGQYQTARNLYGEVRNYHRPRWLVASRVRDGDLALAFRAKIERTAPPSRPAERAAWPTDRADLLVFLDGEALKAYREALEAAETFPTVKDDAEIVVLLASACAGATRIDPATPGRYRACSR